MNHFLTDMQDAVSQSGADAWVLFDMRRSNNLAWDVLRVDPNAHCTRRWMVIIPAHGRPVKITHRMEQDPLAHLTIEAEIHGVLPDGPPSSNQPC
jgi:hypothetical protein